MKVESKLAKKLANGDFIVTAEFLPKVGSDAPTAEAAVKAMGNGFTAVNVADNCHNIGMSSIAASVAVLKSGAEPICQMVTRDRNRIAIQSDLLGAAYLGIKNLLCLSGYHQTLATCPESANVYDIDSTQLIEMVTNMGEKGVLADGTKIEGQFSMLVGAVANPFQKPVELNMLRLQKKVEAGAKFIQTSAIFDIETFGQWLNAAISEGITAKAAILAGVLPLDCAVEAERLRNTYTDYSIPDSVIDRLKKAGDAVAQKKEGLNICIETIGKLKKMKGLRGIHIHCGCKGKVSPEVIAAALS
ncbi:MAG: methylenetetrahydrofolate reductase [Sedimentisphaerales bacterium]|jgi:methylenetetrahydrofolate reductase (NADPH)